MWGGGGGGGGGGGRGGGKPAGICCPPCHNQEFQELEYGKLPDSVLLMCKIPIYGIKAITKSMDS